MPKVAFSNSLFKQNYSLSLEPNNWFFKEIGLSYVSRRSDFFENRLKTNVLIDEKWKLLVSAQRNKVEFKSTLFTQQFRVGETTVTRRDIDLSLSYKKSNQFSLTLEGVSLLTLLELDNQVANIQTVNNQGITTITTNPNILGYLLAGIQIKF